MSLYKEAGKAPAEDGTPIHGFKMAFTSRNVNSFVKLCSDHIQDAKEKNLKVKGPVHMPTKTVWITTDKTLCREGSKMRRIGKRLIDLQSSSEIVKQAISINIADA